MLFIGPNFADYFRVQKNTPGWIQDRLHPDVIFSGDYRIGFDEYYSVACGNGGQVGSHTQVNFPAKASVPVCICNLVVDSNSAPNPTFGAGQIITPTLRTVFHTNNGTYSKNETFTVTVTDSYVRISLVHLGGTAHIWLQGAF